MLFLHGFMRDQSMWFPLMQHLCENGFRCVAFDQRGYSPSARPDNVEAYAWTNLVADAFAVADSFDMGDFHLIGDGLGAALGYSAVAGAQGQELIESFTAISWPHPNTFTPTLSGTSPNAEQVLASQSWLYFAVEGSATQGGNFLFNNLGSDAGFTSADNFQKALWWWNSLQANGSMAWPAEEEDLDNETAPPELLALQSAFQGVNLDAEDAVVPEQPMANLTMPLLYIAGFQAATHERVHAAAPWAMHTRNEARHYGQLVVSGDDFLTPRDDISSPHAVVFNTILGHLQQERVEEDAGVRPTRAPPPLPETVVWYRNGVFWTVMGVLVFSVVVGAYVALTGNEEEKEFGNKIIRTGNTSIGVESGEQSFLSESENPFKRDARGQAAPAALAAQTGTSGQP